jgi:hypothetical protein
MESEDQKRGAVIIDILGREGDLWGQIFIIDKTFSPLISFPPWYTL